MPISTAVLRVLLVDDEPDFTAIMGHSLRDTGRYDVREETDSRKVLEAVREFRPDVILLDVMMPELDGGDVAAQLAQYRDTSGIPIIFLTCLVDGEEATLGGLLSGGHCFLPKPVSVAEVMQCIDELVDSRAAKN